LGEDRHSVEQGRRSEGAAHSPGMILPERTYVLGEDAVGSLQNAGIRFSQLSRASLAPRLEEVAGERV
jgi:hypothetical protein